jgi:hypothetical protein
MEHTEQVTTADSERRATRPITTGTIAAAFATLRAAAAGAAAHRRKLRKAIRFIGADGTPLVLNPLPDGSRAIIEAEDYDSFVKLGLTTQWFLDDNGSGNLIVRFNMPSARPGKRSNNASVARIVLDAGSGSRVRYRDKNPLNLTRVNLYLADGYSKGRERALVRSLAHDDTF